MNSFQSKNFVNNDLNYDLFQSDEDYLDIKINYIALNKSGPIEIGQALEILINYTINCSDNYFVLENWVDITHPPLNMANLIYPKENNVLNLTCFIDPERFSPDGDTNFSAFSNIKILALDGTYFTRAATSTEKVQVLKADLETELISNVPDLIFSNEKLEISYKIFNEHNNNYSFKNQDINYELFDSELNLVQNGSKTTNEEGVLSLTLDFDKGRSGTYHLNLIANNLEDYHDYFFYNSFAVRDINSSFKLSIENESDLYASTFFDAINTPISLESEYEGIFEWNTGYENGIFTKSNSSMIFETSIKNFEYSGNVTFNVYGNLIDFNKSISFSKTLTFKRRSLILPTSSMAINNFGEIEINQQFLDNLTNKSFQFDFIAEYYIKVENQWNFLFSSKDYQGLIQKSIKNNSFTMLNMSQLILKVKINSLIYQFEQQLCNLSIPKLLVNYATVTKSSTSELINGTLFNEKGEVFENQLIKIVINNVFYKDIMTSINGTFSFEVSTSNFNDKINILLCFGSNFSYLSYNYYIIIDVQPNEFFTLISNSGLIFSIFLILPFCILLIQSQKGKNRMINLKI